jgi:hypothetical protein
MVEMLKCLRVTALIQGEPFKTEEWVMLDTPEDAPTLKDSVSCGVTGRGWNNLPRNLSIDTAACRPQFPAPFVEAALKMRPST